MQLLSSSQRSKTLLCSPLPVRSCTTSALQHLTTPLITDNAKQRGKWHSSMPAVCKCRLLRGALLKMKCPIARTLPWTRSHKVNSLNIMLMLSVHRTSLSSGINRVSRVTRLSKCKGILERAVKHSPPSAIIDYLVGEQPLQSRNSNIYSHRRLQLLSRFAAAN